MAREGIPYTLPVKLARQHGVITANQYDQHPRALRWRAAIRRAVKRGLLRRVKGSRPSCMRYVATNPTE